MKLRSGFFGIVGSAVLFGAGKAAYEGAVAIYGDHANKFFDDSVSPFLMEHVWPRVHPVVDWLNNFWGGVAVALSLALVIERLWAWRFQDQDQATIADLRRQLDEPERQRRQAFENGLIQARAEFALEMRKYMYGRNAPHIMHTAQGDLIQHLESYAVVFASDNYFDRLWQQFVGICGREVSVLKIPLDYPDPDGFVENQVNRSVNYYFSARREFTRAIIAYLTYDAGYKDDPFKKISDIRDGCVERGMVEIWDVDSLQTALAHR